MTFHKIDNDAIQLREVIANKTFNGKQGAYQQYHVIKNENVAELLDLFYAYDGTFINVFSHNPNVSQSEEEV